MVSLVPEEAAPSTSVSDDETLVDQKIAKLQQQINRQFAIDDYKSAVSMCEELCTLTASKYNELHDKCAGPYYQYATALIELAREENQILGAEKLGVGEGEEGEGPDSTDQATANTTTTDASESTDAAENTDATENTDTTENTDAADAAEVSAEGDEEEGEDVTSLQIAWEVLELSRIIYSRQETPEAQKKLAKVKIKLGEVHIENEKTEEAITQFKESIEHLLAAGEEPHSREISSSYYMMGLAASFDQKYEDAIEFYSKCSELMNTQIEQLEGSERTALQETKTEVDKMVADSRDSLRQLDQYRRLIPALSGCDSSTAGPSSSAASGASSSAAFGASSSNGATSSSTPVNSVTPITSAAPSSSTGFGSSGSGAPVSNISHLVRKRPVSQPVQPVSQTTPSSSSEISAKLSVKPTVRVSPMVSSSTSPGNSAPGNTTPANQAAARSSSVQVQSSSEAQAVPSHAVPPRTHNRHSNGVSSTSGLDSRFAGSASGFANTASSSEAEGRVSDIRPSNSSRQVATVSSVQRTEEAISSSSDFKRPAEEVEDMNSNEAKRSRQ